jgi:hypothetical protein
VPFNKTAASNLAGGGTKNRCCTGKEARIILRKLSLSSDSAGA